MSAPNSQMTNDQLSRLKLAGISNSYGMGNYDGYYAEDNLDDSPNKQRGVGKTDDIYIMGIMDGDKRIKIKIF